MPTHCSSLPRRKVLHFNALLLLPLLLLVCLPWQPFMTQALQSGWLWWPYALTRMVDLPGLVFTIAALLLLTKHKLTLDGRALLALAGALFAVLASDWVIKSLIKLLTEEPRPYLI
ncbi:MAG: phosphatidylglycerophosphatase, partial [Aeromonas sp.]|nr:phosphatidylglycerophosphatase [Aeromonas sp.]